MNPLRKVNNLDGLKLNPQAIEKAVAAFVQDSRTYESGADPAGLYQQTIENIAAITVYKQDNGRYFWLADYEGEVMAYALTSVSKDVDNKLCYWMTQAWVHPALRRQPIVKHWLQVLREDARRQMCAHIMIPSSRGAKAYCRFLGVGWKPYVTILKEDI